MRETLKKFYLDYLNNWLTVKAMAEHHDISIADCLALINIGRDYHAHDHETKLYGSDALPFGVSESRRSIHA